MKIFSKTTLKVLVLGGAAMVGTLIGVRAFTKSTEPEMIEITEVVSEDEENESI